MEFTVICTIFAIIGIISLIISIFAILSENGVALLSILPFAISLIVFTSNFPVDYTVVNCYQKNYEIEFDDAAVPSDKYIFVAIRQYDKMPCYIEVDQDFYDKHKHDKIITYGNGFCTEIAESDYAKYGFTLTGGQYNE